MAEIWLNAQIQGMTPDGSRATGSYDPIDLGTLSVDQVAGLLAAMTRMPLPPDNGEDLCQPHLLLQGPLGSHSFEVVDGSGTLYSAEADGNITFDQAMIMVTGKPYRGAGVAAPHPPPPFPSARPVPPPPPGWGAAPPPPLPGRGPTMPPPPPLPGHGPTMPPPPPFPGRGPTMPPPPSGGPASWPAPSVSPGGPSPAFCPGCGGALQPGQRFCATCGNPVGGPVAPPPPPAGASPGPGQRPGAAGPSAPVGGDPQVWEALEMLRQVEANPLPLGEFRARMPWMAQGETGPFWNQIRETIQAGKDADLLNLLPRPPRDVGIQKPGLFRRLLTLVIDLPACVVLMLIGSVVLLPLVEASKDPLAGAVFIVWFVLVYGLYFAGSEWLLGATPGGMLLGVRVVDGFGNPASLGLCLVRLFTRFLPIFAVVLGVVTAKAVMGRPGMRHQGVNVGARMGKGLRGFDISDEVVMA